MRSLRRPSTLREMRDWHRHTPKLKPVLVYGRHAAESSLIEDNLETFERKGYKIFKVPATETVIQEPGRGDRREYHRLLSRTFKGRKVVDLHTAPGCHIFMGEHFEKNVAGLEIPVEKIGPIRANVSMPAMIRGTFRKKAKEVKY
jgi:hypothetical protein